MSLFLTLLSLVLCYFSPGEWFPSLGPYHIQQIILLPAIAISLAAMTMRKTGLPAPHYLLMMGLWMAVVLSFMSRLMLRSSFNVFIDFGILVIYYFLVLTNAFTVPRVRLICGILAACAVIMAFQGILGFHFGYLGDKLLAEAMDENFFMVKRVRAFGILSDPNDFAQFLLVGLALLGAFWKKRNFVASVFLLALPAAIILYGVYLTGSRGAMFGLAIIVFATASSRLGRLPSIALAAVMFLVMMGAQFGAGRQISLHEGSAGGRVMAWGVGIGFLKTNPLFGIGYSQFSELNELTAHNSFVLCFSELGIFGYFVWLALIVTSLMGLHRLAKLPVKTQEDADLHRVVVTVRTALYCFLVTSWFLSRTYNPTLYVLLALAAALSHQRPESMPEAAVRARRWIPLTFAVQVASIILIYATIRLRSL